MSKPLQWNFDGGGGSDGGPCGWGWYRNDGVSGCGGLPPGNSSNIAEYTALTMAVRDALGVYQSYGGDTFRFVGDSKLVVEQVLGNWQVRSDKLRPYVNNVKMLLHGLPEWELHWVPRKQNKMADEMAWKGKTMWEPGQDMILVSGPQGSVIKEFQRGWRE